MCITDRWLGRGRLRDLGSSVASPRLHFGILNPRSRMGEKLTKILELRKQLENKTCNYNNKLMQKYGLDQIFFFRFILIGFPHWIERSLIKSYKINKHSFPFSLSRKKVAWRAGPGGERAIKAVFLFRNIILQRYLFSLLLLCGRCGRKHTLMLVGLCDLPGGRSGSVAGPQYTQFTGTHWGSLHSLSTAACNVSKALSRLSLTMVRSK